MKLTPLEQFLCCNNFVLTKIYFLQKFCKHHFRRILKSRCIDDLFAVGFYKSFSYFYQHFFIENLKSTDQGNVIWCSFLTKGWVTWQRNTFRQYFVFVFILWYICKTISSNSRKHHIHLTFAPPALINFSDMVSVNSTAYRSDNTIQSIVAFAPSSDLSALKVKKRFLAAFCMGHFGVATFNRSKSERPFGPVLLSDSLTNVLQILLCLFHLSAISFCIMI